MTSGLPPDLQEVHRRALRRIAEEGRRDLAAKAQPTLGEKELERLRERADELTGPVLRAALDQTVTFDEVRLEYARASEWPQGAAKAALAENAFVEADRGALAHLVAGRLGGAARLREGDVSAVERAALKALAHDLRGVFDANEPGVGATVVLEVATAHEAATDETVPGALRLALPALWLEPAPVEEAETPPPPEGLTLAPLEARVVLAAQTMTLAEVCDLSVGSVLRITGAARLCVDEHVIETGAMSERSGQRTWKADERDHSGALLDGLPRSARALQRHQ